LFTRVFGFDEGFQVGEAMGPEGAVLLDPRIDGAQGFRVELVDAVPAFAVFADQMCSTQQAQVLGNSRARDGERFGDLSSGLAASAQKVEDSTARGIGQSLEGCFWRICNRSVTHNA